MEPDRQTTEAYSSGVSGRHKRKDTSARMSVLALLSNENPESHASEHALAIDP